MASTGCQAYFVGAMLQGQIEKLCASCVNFMYVEAMNVQVFYVIASSKSKIVLRYDGDPNMCKLSGPFHVPARESRRKCLVVLRLLNWMELLVHLFNDSALHQVALGIERRHCLGKLFDLGS